MCVVTILTFNYCGHEARGRAGCDRWADWLRNTSNTDPECPGLGDYITRKDVEELCGNCRAKRLARRVAWDGEWKEVARKDHRHPKQDVEWATKCGCNHGLPLDREDEIRELEMELDESAPEGGWNHGFSVYQEEETRADQMRMPSCDIPIPSIETYIKVEECDSFSSEQWETDDYESRYSSDTPMCEFSPDTPDYDGHVELCPDMVDDAANRFSSPGYEFSPVTPKDYGDTEIKGDPVNDAAYRYSSPVYRSSPLTPEYYGDAELKGNLVDDIAYRYSSPVYRFSPLTTPEYEGEAEISDDPVDITDCAIQLLAAN